MAGDGDGEVPSALTATDGVCIDSPMAVAVGPADRSPTANVTTPSFVDTATYGVTTPAPLASETSVGLDVGLALMSAVATVVPMADAGEDALPSGTLNSFCCCSSPGPGRFSATKNRLRLPPESA